MTSKTPKQIVQIELEARILEAARRRAQSLGMSFSEYVEFLILKDVQAAAQKEAAQLPKTG